MSTKLKLTKESLSREKKALARFSRFLPTLKLRKTQLFNEIHRIGEEIAEADRQHRKKQEDIAEWVAVFADDVAVEDYCRVKETVIRSGNVAGIEIPLLEEVTFEEQPYDLMTMPFWLDAGIEAVKQTVHLAINLRVLRRQLDIIEEELRTTVQRINLFEKVKIPQAQENIRRIRIFLGDQQTAAVVRGKMTKSKLTRKRQGAAAAAAARA